VGRQGLTENVAGTFTDPYKNGSQEFFKLILQTLIILKSRVLSRLSIFLIYRALVQSLVVVRLTLGAV
jgi:hypothetical protein